MQALIGIIIQAGHAALDVVLYTLLPIMVVMMVLMRILEVQGVLDLVVRWLTPLARPFGLTGLAVLALVQTTLVSFVAPLPTLAMMEDRGASTRHLAAALAAILAMAPANGSFPMIVFGLHIGPLLAWSMIGGLSASAATYWLFGRSLSAHTHAPNQQERAVQQADSILRIINVSGGEAIRIVFNITPLLILSMAVVIALQNLGAVDFAVQHLSPSLHWAGINPDYVLPTLTKYLAGGTALVGLAGHMSKTMTLPPHFWDNVSGFLLHPLDPPGVAILISAGARVGQGWLPAVLGALFGITVRTTGSLVCS